MGEEVKPWYQSKTIIGGVVGMLSYVLSKHGIVVDDAQIGFLCDLFSALGEVAGMAMVWYGRINATKGIK